MDPFRPAMLRIHPLTHVDIAAAGGVSDGKKDAPPAASPCRLMLHFELRDRYGDSIKALGKLHVEMANPAGNALPGMESSGLSWDVPEMIGADENFKRFDGPTRTYRIALNAPKWLADYFARPAAERKDAPRYFKLRVVFELPGTEGKYLLDEYVISG